MDELRSWWEVPSITYFCKLFQTQLKLPEFDIEELEEAILLSATVEGSEILTSLMCALLKGYYNRRDIEQFNCDFYLRKLLQSRWSERSPTDNPLTDCDFRCLTSRTKVEVLYELCQWRLLVDDVGDLVKDFEGDELRVQPVGTDEQGSSYWYFLGTRLYKETETVQAAPPAPAARRDTDDEPQRKKSSIPKKLSSTKKKRKAAKKKGHKKKARKKDTAVTVKKEVRVREWRLVCSTVEEWQALANSFKNSKARCERELYKRLVEEFLVEIPKILEEKERMLRKKFLEMAPKRTSNRLHHKRQEHEEQLKLIEVMEEAEQREMEQMEAERRQVAEERRKELAAIAREERVRLKEERAQRAMLRELRLALMAEGKEIPPELMNADSPLPSTSETEIVAPQPPVPAVAAFEEDEDITPKLSKVLQKVRKHKSAWPFLEPVPVAVAPDYYTIISKPMDLSAMELKIKRKEYTSRKDFENDFDLMVNNCLLYNGAFNEFALLAKSLQEVCIKAMERCFAPKKPRTYQVEAVHELSGRHSWPSASGLANGLATPPASATTTLASRPKVDLPRPSTDVHASRLLVAASAVSVTALSSNAIVPRHSDLDNVRFLPKVSTVGSRDVHPAKRLVPVMSPQQAALPGQGLAAVRSSDVTFSMGSAASQAVPQRLGATVAGSSHAPPRTVLLVMDQSKALTAPSVVPIAPAAANVTPSTGAMWPTRPAATTLVAPSAASPAAAPLSGWRTIIPSTLSSRQPGTVLSAHRILDIAKPAADVSTARLFTNGIAASAAPSVLRSATTPIAVTSVVQTKLNQPLQVSSQVVSRGAWPTACNVVATTAATSRPMQSSSVVKGVNSVPLQLSAANYGTASSSTADISNGSQTLIFPASGWLPSHLNLHAVAGSASSPVTTAVGGGILASPPRAHILKRPAEAARYDSPAKKPATSSSSASLTENSQTYS